MATLTVRLDSNTKGIARVTCPPGMGAAGLTQPRTQDGRVALRHLSAYQYSDRDMDAIKRGGRRTAAIRYAAKPLAAPVIIRVGTLCKRC